MNPYAIPPIVAGIVAVVIAFARRLSAILVSQPNTPPAETLTLYTMGGRFASFLLVYGLVLGLAYWAASRRHDDAGASLALATGVVATIGHLVGIGLAAQLIEPGRENWLLDAVFSVGSSIAVGVQLAVVAFAGAALARRRRSGDDSADAPTFDRSQASRSD